MTDTIENTLKIKCNQEGCTQDAVYQYTWPGQKEAGICEEHSKKLQAIADAMGFYIQLKPIFEKAND